MPESNGNANVEYRQIDQFPAYRVGSDGSVWSIFKLRNIHGRRGCESYLAEPWRRLVCPKNGHGYRIVAFRNKGTEVRRQVHQIVAEYFLGPCPDNMEVNHKNGIKTDNRVSNLEYVTDKENVQHAIRTGLRRQDKTNGMNHGNAVMCDEDVFRMLSLEGAMTQRKIAGLIGVSKNVVNAVFRGKAWKHITGRTPPTRDGRFKSGIAK